MTLTAIPAQNGPDLTHPLPTDTPDCCAEPTRARDAGHCGHDRPLVRHVVEGDLTIYSASEQKPKLLSVFRTPYSEIELDLGQVNEIDTAGVQLLILGCRITVMVGGSLRLTNIGPQVVSVLELMDLEETFTRAQNHCPVCADQRTRTHD